MLLCETNTKGCRTLADFLSADKKSSLVGQCLTVLDLKTSCWALSASVRWIRTICWGLCVPPPIRKCHDSHISGIGAILILDDLAPGLNAVSCELMAQQILT